MPARAVGGGGGGVEERDARAHGEMQERLGIRIVDLHHVVDIVLHRVRARTLVKDGVDVRPIEIALLDELEEVVLLLVVDEVQPAQILVVLTVLQVVDDEDILMSALIQRMDEVAADEAGAELVALVEAGASELTATLGATDVVGATDIDVTVSVAAGATVVVAALSGAVIGGVVVEAPSP